jgi:hypothetical protein
VREQTEAILKSGATDGVEVLDRPIVLFTTTGAKSGKKRYVPLMRVEENGRPSIAYQERRRLLRSLPVVVDQAQQLPSQNDEPG